MLNDLTPRKRKRLERDIVVLELALGRLPRTVRRPALVVLSGLPGTGKSYLARQIVRRHPLAVVESDALRKALINRPSYSKAESARLFAACHEVIDRLLAAGVPVLLDATNLKEMHRRPLRDIAKRRRAKLVLIEVVAAEVVALERLESRFFGGDPRDSSDAGPEVYEKLRYDVEPIQERHITVDTSRDIRPALDAITAALQAIGE